MEEETKEPGVDQLLEKLQKANFVASEKNVLPIKNSLSSLNNNKSRKWKTFFCKMITDQQEHKKMYLYPIKLYYIAHKKAPSRSIPWRS